MSDCGIDPDLDGGAAGVSDAPAGLSLLLPWPPSRNVLWRAVSLGRGRARVMLKSRQYNDWWKEAEIALAMQEHHRIPGEVAITLDLHPPTKREYDPDNYSKAILDFIVAMFLIDGDSHKTIKVISIFPWDRSDVAGVWAHIDPSLSEGARTAEEGSGHTD